MKHRVYNFTTYSSYFMVLLVRLRPTALTFYRFEGKHTILLRILMFKVHGYWYCKKLFSML